MVIIITKWRRWWFYTSSTDFRDFGFNSNIIHVDVVRIGRRWALQWCCPSSSTTITITTCYHPCSTSWTCRAVAARPWPRCTPWPRWRTAARPVTRTASSRYCRGRRLPGPRRPSVTSSGRSTAWPVSPPPAWPRPHPISTTAASSTQPPRWPTSPPGTCIGQGSKGWSTTRLPGGTG